MRNIRAVIRNLGTGSWIAGCGYALAFSVVWLLGTAFSGASGLTGLLANLLSTDLNSVAVGAAAAHGSLVQWWLPGLEAGGELWPVQLLLGGSPLALLMMGPLLGGVLIGILVVKRAGADRYALGAASAVSYAVLTTGISALASVLSGDGAAVLHTPSWLVFALALVWVAATGLIGASLYDRVTAVRSLFARNATAVLAAVSMLATLMVAGSVPSGQIEPEMAAEPKTVPAPVNHQRDGVVGALAKVRATSGDRFNVSRDPWRGVPSLVSMQSPMRTDVNDWLRDNAGLFAVADPGSQLRSAGSQYHGDAINHWFEQNIAGVPVFGARVGVHLDAAGKSVQTLSNGMYPELVANQTKPELPAEAAVAFARQVKPNSKLTEAAKLFLLPGQPQPGKPIAAQLVWQVVLADPRGGDESATAYFVDATQKQARVVKTMAKSVPARNRVVRDFALQVPPNDDYRPNPSRVEGQGDTGIFEVDNAYKIGGEFYDFLQQKFQRDSFDGHGATLDIQVRLRVEEGKPYENAYYNENVITFGEGMVTHDILAHEFTHGIIDHSAGLIYQDQSGALNESFADMLGETFEYFYGSGNDWLMGAGSPLGAFRSMADPTLFGDPAHTRDFKHMCADHGGVHFNSGIPNKAFFILSQRIGIARASQFAYRAVTRYLHSTSGFNDARAAFLQSAWDLAGKSSQEAIEVERAWGAVGVDGNHDIGQKECSYWCFAAASLQGEGLSGLDPLGMDLGAISAALLRTRDLLASGDTPSLAHYQQVYTRANEDALRLLTGDVNLQRQTAHAMQSLAPLLEAVGTPRGRQLTASPGLINELNALVDAFVAAGRAKGANSLANLLTSERSRIDTNALVGLTADQIKIYLDQRLDTDGVPVDLGIRNSLNTSGTADVMVMFKAKADFAGMPSSRTARTKFVRDRLSLTAQQSQASLKTTLQQKGVRFEQFWIVNAIAVYGADANLVNTLAANGSVARIRSVGAAVLQQAQPAQVQSAIDGVEWGVSRVGAPEVWASGARGQGIVVANIDTGVQFDHPALAAAYRGRSSSGVINHNYSWFDPTKVCAGTAPCDNNNHGTHTMGTMVGDGGIGVAPGAKWISAKGCGSSSCDDTTLLKAGQWMMAPTDLNGQNPKPELAPHIINNSWGGYPGDPFYAEIVNSWVQAGIVPVFANGNSGPSCGSAGSPGDYPNAYSVGAFNADGAIASFSGRGESAFNHETKPNIAAPGVSVRSAVPGGQFASLSGTSMAAPHVAGSIALLWSAAPALVGDIAATRQILDDTAVDVYDGQCGGTADDNNVWGEGKIDALSAVAFSPKTPLTSLVGTVVDRKGAAIAGAGVEARLPSGARRAALTDASGAYSLMLPAGTYELSAEAFGFKRFVSSVTVVAGQSNRRDVTLQSNPRYRVTGKVVHGGQPVVATAVRLEGVPLSAATTDGDGGFMLPNVPAGDYTLSVASGQCAGETTMALTVDWDERVTVTPPDRTDADGYHCTPITTPFPTTSQVLALTGDDNSQAVTLPFEFMLYGKPYTTAYISTNGAVNFEQDSAMSLNTGVPSTSSPNAALFPFWDDLLIDDQASVRTGSTATSLVVEWRNAAIRSAPGQRVTFAVTLTANGQVSFHYGSLTGGDLARGASASIGIEDRNGRNGFEFSHDQAILFGGTALRFSGPVTLSGTVTDYDGNPQSYVAIQYGSTTISTDYRGRYRVVVPPGAVELKLTHASLADRTLTVSAAPEEMRTLDIKLFKRRNVITGRVVDTDGKPVAGKTVRGYYLYEDTSHGPGAVTDANGYYRIEDAAPIRAYFAVTEHCFPYNYFQTTEITHDQTVNLVVQRPSDRFGHRCDQVTAQTITPTTKLALTGDNNSQAVTLPFPINYYGTTQTTANISTNGLITFGGPFTAAPNETNINGPTSGVSGNGAAPMGSVYAYWDDLVIDSSASVWTGTVGSTGFVVEWRNALIAGTTLRVTVQAVLYADDRVRFQFVSIPDDSRAWGTYTGVGMESPHSGESLDGMQLVWRLSVNANPYVYLQQKQIAASGLAIEFRRF